MLTTHNYSSNYYLALQPHCKLYAYVDHVVRLSKGDVYISSKLVFAVSMTFKIVIYRF